MGHNISELKRRRMMLEAPLADWADWALAIDCGGQHCPRHRRYAVAELAQAHPERTLLDTLNRLRCSACSGDALFAAMIRQDPEQVIVLRGVDRARWMGR